MANDSTKLSFFGKRYLRKLEQAAMAWRQSKASGAPYNAQLANDLQEMRATYREKYRPVLAEGRGVTAGEPVS